MEKYVVERYISLIIDLDQGKPQLYIYMYIAGKIGFVIQSFFLLLNIYLIPVWKR